MSLSTHSTFKLSTNQTTELQQPSKQLLNFNAEPYLINTAYHSSIRPNDLTFSRQYVELSNTKLSLATDLHLNMTLSTGDQHVIDINTIKLNKIHQRHKISSDWIKSIPQPLLNNIATNSITSSGFIGLHALQCSTFTSATFENVNVFRILSQIYNPNLKIRSTNNQLVFDLLNSCEDIPYFEKHLPLKQFISTLTPLPLPKHDLVTFSPGNLYYKKDIRSFNLKDKGKPTTLRMDDIPQNSNVYLQRLDPLELAATATSEIDNYGYAIQRSIYMNNSVQTITNITDTVLLGLLGTIPSIETGLVATYSSITTTGTIVSIDSAFCPYLSPAFYVIRHICKHYNCFPILDRDGLIHVNNIITSKITTTLALLFTHLISVHSHFMSGMPYEYNIAQLYYILQLHQSDSPDASILDLKDVAGEAISYVSQNIDSGFVTSIDSNLLVKRSYLNKYDNGEKPTFDVLNPVSRAAYIKLISDRDPTTAARRITLCQEIIAENSFVTSALVQNENYLQKLFNDQGMNLDFTAQNESQSFGSKSSFSQNSNDQHKNKNNGSDEKLNHIKDKSEVVGIEDDSSRHMINVIA
jgi:hypothetical protein